MEKSLERLSLVEEQEKEDGFVFLVEKEPKKKVDVSLCLVRRFLTEKPIHFNVMKERMAVIWRLRRDILIKEMERDLYQFQFYYMVDFNCILQSSP